MISVQKVLASGAFPQVGQPTAVDSSAHLVVVGGSLGPPQWNGRDVHSRAKPKIGWEPVGIYEADTLACRWFLTSRWPVNSIAIHPTEQVIAIGTGCYDGGYGFEGELLIHDLSRGATRSVLRQSRAIASVAWADVETLEITMPPPTDEGVDWPDVPHEAALLASSDWGALAERDVDLTGVRTLPVTAPPMLDRDALQARLGKLALAGGHLPLFRRQAWALAAELSGVLVGVEGGLERWTQDGELAWRRSIPGHVPVQALAMSTERVLVAAWAIGEGSYDARLTHAAVIDRVSGAIVADVDPDAQRVAVTTSSGLCLLRDTRIGHSEGPRPADIIDAEGQRVGEVHLGRYDMSNHYFAIKGAKELLVLVGAGANHHLDKQVAAVRPTPDGSWAVEKLYPLAWEPGRHLFGGPGVWLSDDAGEAIVHAGAIHDGSGVLSGNVFLARRSHPLGTLHWEVRLDNAVTDVELVGGLIIAATNVGEVLQIDARDGRVVSANTLRLDGWPAVPLSLAAAGDGRVWASTLDGRAALIDLQPDV